MNKISEKLKELQSTYQQNELVILDLYRRKETLLEQLEKLKEEIKNANNHQAGVAREIQDLQDLLKADEGLKT
jgi:chromosome segregation ATPase